MQQQQQEAPGPAQMSPERPSRGPFPWFRVFLTFGITLLLSLFVAIPLLIKQAGWVAFLPTLSSLVSAIISALTWIFPFDPLSRSEEPPALSASHVPVLPEPPSVSVLAPVTQHIASTLASDIALSEQLAATSISLVLDTQAATGTPLVPLAVLPHLGIFHYDERELPNPGEFYGRIGERLDLIDRVSRRNSTAIVGAYRMGKSWLMQYLQQIAPTHPLLGSRVRVGRLYALDVQCQTRDGFVTQALKELEVLYEPVVYASALKRLTEAASQLADQDIIPVLCIDEFAGLVGRPGFDKEFIQSLRVAAERWGLVLITSSVEPLYQVVRQMTGEESHLLNILSEINLKSFTELEARGFVREKGQRDNLSHAEQEFFLACSAVRGPDGKHGWPPMLLQLAGHTLVKDKSVALLGYGLYDLDDPAYRTDFRQRLAERYHSVVRDI